MEDVEDIDKRSREIGRTNKRKKERYNNSDCYGNVSHYFYVTIKKCFAK